MRKLLLVAVASVAMAVAACSPSNNPGGVDSSPDLGASPEIPVESLPVESLDPSPSAS